MRRYRFKRVQKFLHKVHLWAGLTLFIPIVLLGLTGSILTFERELINFFDPPVISDGNPYKPDEILKAAQAAAPADLVANMYRPGATPNSAVTVGFSRGGKNGEGGGGRFQLHVDPVSLAVTPAGGGISAFMRQLSQFHSSLMLRDYGGRSIVGWFGVVMLLFGITGIVMWWPRKGYWKRGFKVGSKSHGQRFYRELHGAAGIWSVVILIIVSASGICLAFPHTMDDAVGSVFPTRDLRATPHVSEARGRNPMSMGKAIDMAEKACPNTRLFYVILPQQSEQPMRIALLPSNSPDSNPPIQVFIDPWVKNILEIRDPQDYSTGETIIAWKRALHSGQAFGWPWRILVFTAGVMPMLFAFTGISMWMSKRRIRRRRTKRHI